MRLHACSALLLLLAACASVPAAPSMPRPHVLVLAPPPSLSIRLVSAPMEPVQQGSRIGRADLEQARALLSRARNDLEPRQWEVLDRKLTAAERAFERFSSAAKTSGQAAEVVRGAEGLAQAGRARTLAGALSRVGPLLVGLVLLWPSSTAGSEFDSRPPWVDAQREFEARLRDVSESSRQLMVEFEAQPGVEKAPAREPSPRKQPPSALVEEDDPRCRPIPLPRHLGGHGLHNECADKMPNNSFPGGDVFVNGNNFDALQLVTRTLWEVKTTAIETYNPFVREREIEKQVPKLRSERALALACGFDFRIGVRSATHKDELERMAPDLEGIIVVMNWC
ncbi:DUF6310 domain-containing protein [Cystobacter fuscus]|uniref:DUF6310 domain-containing protein n=1 Tax=Cystobacter fuscus TaxID=43 RepID=UPI0037BF7245